jgi:hypothetical protein
MRRRPPQPAPSICSPSAFASHSLMPYTSFSRPNLYIPNTIPIPIMCASSLSHTPLVTQLCDPLLHHAQSLLYTHTPRRPFPPPPLDLMRRHGRRRAEGQWHLPCAIQRRLGNGSVIIGAVGIGHCGIGHFGLYRRLLWPGHASDNRQWAAGKTATAGGGKTEA